MDRIGHVLRIVLTTACLVHLVFIVLILKGSLWYPGHFISPLLSIMPFVSHLFNTA